MHVARPTLDSLCPQLPRRPSHAPSKTAFKGVPALPIVTQKLAQITCHNGPPATLPGAVRRHTGSKTQGPSLLGLREPAMRLDYGSLFYPLENGAGMVTTRESSSEIHTRGCGVSLSLSRVFLLPKSPAKAERSLCHSPITVLPGLADLQGTLKMPGPTPPAHGHEEHTCG